MNYLKNRDTFQKIIENCDPTGLPTIQLVLKAQKGIKLDHGRLGVFPSSFNPITVAHAALIEQAMQIWNLNEILLLLDRQNVDKEVFGASLEERLVMLTLFARNKPHLSIGLSSHGLFLDKLSALRHFYPPNTAIYFVVGYDTIVRVLDEKYYHNCTSALNQLFKHSRFLVANRGKGGIREIRALFELEGNRSFKDKVETFEISDFLASVSSTQVRERVKQGKSITELVPPEIEAYIQETKLYSEGEE